MERYEIKQNLIEYTCLITLFIGIILSIFSNNKYIVYIVIFLFGLISGKITLILKKKKEDMFWYYFIVTSFLIGYIIGSKIITSASILTILIIFILGNIISYSLYNRNILKPY